MAAATSPDFSSLNVAQRQAALGTLRSTTFDVLVVGGGVVGAGAAVDAASRGLSVAVIEAGDWAGGTSSRSSKLVHGGIRYLEQLDFALVREALIERGRLLRTIAPHLVHPIPFLYPLKKPLIERVYIGAGMLLYDIFSYSGGHRPGVPLHRHVSRTTVLERMPGLRPSAFRGGLRYFDAQVDDARLVSTLIRTAADAGAAAASWVSAVGICSGDPLHIVTARDEETGQQFEIRARSLITATGVWTEESQALIGGARGFGVTMSKGVHIVVDRDRLPGDWGMILRAGPSVLLVIPWGSRWLIGTTDTPWSFDKASPSATSADVDYLLAQINTVLADPLTRSDVCAIWSGLRPLVAGRARSTAKLSREHVVDVPQPGIAVVAGGKLTTYRVMARDAVDAAVRGRVDARRSRTARLPLVGARALTDARAALGDLLRIHGLPPELGERLFGRYGDRVAEVLAPIGDEPTLAATLPDASGAVGAEVRYAVTHEGALHLDDVLSRRLRIGMESTDAGLAAAPVVAAIMATELGWDSSRVSEELALHRDAVDRERSARALPDDSAANAAMTSATAG